MNTSKIEEYTFLNNFRYERKFAITEMPVYGVEEVVKNHPAYFKEIFKIRYINNIYFDTQNLTHYYDNSFGKAQRKKYRIRWYGDINSEVQKPILEIKIKDALLGTKESYKLEPFSLNSDNLMDTIFISLQNSNLPDRVLEQMRTVKPSLVNRYKRKYFIEFSKNYRITVDSEIEYYNVTSKQVFFKEKIRENNSVILELKYNQENNDNASSVSSQLPFRMTKNSKYVNGIEFFNKVSL